MKAFTFVRPATVEEASKAAAVKGSVIKAGGIDLLDRMKERVDEPERVVWLGDIKRSTSPISRPGGNPPPWTMRIDAATTLTEIAESEVVRAGCPALSEAAGLAASPQIRRQATLGGNLCQHTRCGYYRHVSFPCFKRGDATCPVLEDGAVQDTAAIFGNRSCASAHPSSLAPVLAAYEANCIFEPSAAGTMLRMAPRPDAPDQKPSDGFYAAPQRGVRPDTALPSGAILVHVIIPLGSGGPNAVRRGAYEEVRQKAAFDWALASCCARVDIEGDTVQGAGIWLGSVAPTPWHAEAAEKAIVGKPLTDATIRAAADAAVTGATPLPGNAYKLDLVKVVVRRALERLRSAK